MYMDSPTVQIQVMKLSQLIIYSSLDTAQQFRLYSEKILCWESLQFPWN